MTKQLYLTDSYLQGTQVTVTACVPSGDGYAIVLDQTPFYPEGGGQPADQGSIGDVAVTDVQWRDGMIEHKTMEALSVGSVHTATIHWSRRFDHMQQHSGQHLLSAVAFREFGAATVGFHLSGTYTTVDLDQKLTLDQLKSLERLCAEAIVKALPFTVLYPTEAELEALPLRKKPTVDDGIRIVALSDYDYSPCGGTHLKSTAEIGSLTIKKADAYKQGMRLEFVCGFRALEDQQAKSEVLSQLTQLFSAPEADLVSAVQSKLVAFDTLKAEWTKLKNELNALEAQRLLTELEEDVLIGEAVPLFIRQFDDKSMEDMKQIAIQITNEAANASICFISVYNGQNTLLVSRSKELKQPDCKMLFKVLSEEFGVKGGGSPQMAQGGFGDDVDQDQLIEAIKRWIQN